MGEGWKTTFLLGGKPMAWRSREDQRTVRNRLIWEDSAAWIGRIFAIMIFMIGPGAAGVWLDRQLGTKFLSAIGFVVGMALGTTVLLILVNVKRRSLDDEVADELRREDDDAGQPRA
jgi:hypothetical protein